jgi:rod shape-determining protein MreC
MFVVSMRYFFSHVAFLDTISSYAMYPVLVIQSKIISPIKFYFQKRQTLQECYALITRLQAERNELLAQNVQLNALISYESEIQELIDFKKQYHETQGIVAQVLVKNFSEQSHYFLIDKGASAGITLDMVAVYKNCLVGKVVEVFPQYSKLILITDKQCKVAAYCPHTQATGIYEGNNQEQIAGMKYVSHLAQVESEDLVLSSGDGLVFPKGFALGKIKNCNPEGLFYDVSVELLFDLREIDYCFVMQKGSSHMLATDTTQAQCAQLHDFPRSHKSQAIASDEIITVQSLDDTLIHLRHALKINGQELVQQQRHAALIDVDDQDKGVLSQV